MAWADFRKRHGAAHLVSAVVLPPRATGHLKHLHTVLNMIIEQHGARAPYGTATVSKAGVVEIHCAFASKADADGLAQAAGAQAAACRSGWSSHRSFRLSAEMEVTLAGRLEPEGENR